MPERIQMSRQRPWRADNPDAVIVSRPSKYGNPFAVGDVAYWARPAGNIRMTITDRAAAVGAHAHWMSGGKYVGIPDPPDVDELRGRDLACWCPPDQACHGDTLIQLANGDPS